MLDRVAEGGGRSGVPSSPLARLLTALLVVNLGKAITVVALPIFVIERYGLGVEVAHVLALRLVPMMIGGVLSAWILTRCDPRWVAASTMCATGIATMLVPMTETTMQLNLLSIASGGASVFSSPALLALRAHVIPRDAAMKGNGFIVIAEKVPQVVGPAIAAGVLLFTSVSILFYAEAATTVAAALLLIGVPWGRQAAVETSKGHPRQPGRLGVVRSFRALFLDDKRLQGYVVTGFAYAVALSAGRIIFAAIATSVFVSNPSALPIILGTMAVGAVLGGFLASRMSMRHVGTIYVLGNLLEGIGLIGVGLSSSFPLTLALLFFCGICESSATASFFADVQVRLPGVMAGQFFALFLSGVNACAVVGIMFAGWIVPNVSIFAGSLVFSGFILVPVLLYLRVYISSCSGDPFTE